MNRYENKTSDGKNSSTIENKICSIEEKIDRILLENKEKLNRLHSKELDVELFSLKNKKENTIYYLRKKPIKSENATDSDQIENGNGEVKDELNVKIIHKKHIKFGRQKEPVEKHASPVSTTKDLTESEDFNEVISKVDSALYDKKTKETNDVEDADKKIVETSNANELLQTKNLEKNATDSVEKQDFAKETKIPGFDDKRDAGVNSSATDNLTDFKKKYESNLIVSDDLIKKSEPAEDEVKETKIDEISDEKDIPIREGDIGASKIKRHFFKTKEPPEEKITGAWKKKLEPNETIIKHTFNVERIALGEGPDQEEAEVLDKKIKESEEKDDSIKQKRIEPAEKNIKDETSDKKQDTFAYVDTPVFDKESDQEHVFFDEEESSHYGWSPQITSKEKNKISQLSPKKETDKADLNAVKDIELPKDLLKTRLVKLSDLGFSEQEWEELDFYSLNEPFAYVEILRQNETLDKCYFLVEMALNEEEEDLLAFIQDTLGGLSIDSEEMEKKGDEGYLLDRLDQVIREYNIKVSDVSKKKIFYYIGKSALGFAKIDPLMKDPNIEDISCDGACVPLFLYHRKYGSLKSNVRFKDEEELSSFVFKLAQRCGKHISIAEPMLDATMPDGSRIQMTLSDEITAKGSTFTIRKFRSDPFSPPDLIEFNTMSSEMIAYMWLAVENGINTLFAGGTASGKTTTLNALSLFIPREAKIVSIEETREINLPHPNWIPGVARSGFGQIVADRVIGEIDMYDLMKAALRQRPEYIIVGEIRGKEAYVLFQAMATGHATYSTAHADSAQSLIHRLEGKPINIPRVMLQSLDVVCIQVTTRVKNMRARRCKQIIEIIDIDPTTKEILTNEVFHWDPVEDKFIYSGKSYVLERIRAEKDFDREEMTQEINNRKKIVEWMNKNNIREFKEVANVVSQYAESPEDILTKIEKDVK